MPEILLHYIWQKGLFLHLPQHTTDGLPVEVISTGKHNLDAGPDFTDVHLRINGIELVGQVEIHVRSNDWYAHHHDTDASYNNILLHVVRHANQPIYNALNKTIPQMELQYDTGEDYIEQMLHDAMNMDSAIATHPCSKHLQATPDLLTADWKQTLLERRLQCKTDSINRLLNLSHNDWREAFYISLSHAIGFHTNGVPMELLALSTPLTVLSKHRDHLNQLMAVMLGQASLLEEEDDELKREYSFLRTKYNLTPIDHSLWKFGRIRPANHPKVRVKQLAQLIYQSDTLLSQCLETDNVSDLQQLFAPAHMGTDSINSLLINLVAPFLYARGQRQKAISLLQHIPAEQNRIIRQWQEMGQSPKSAADTQALLHLYQTCCEPKQCMHCAVWTDNNLTINR